MKKRISMLTTLALLSNLFIASSSFAFSAPDPRTNLENSNLYADFVAVESAVGALSQEETADAMSVGPDDITLGPDAGMSTYIGLAEPFDGIEFDLTRGDGKASYSVSYWNGSTWVEFDDFILNSTSDTDMLLEWDTDDFNWNTRTFTTNSPAATSDSLYFIHIEMESDLISSTYPKLSRIGILKYNLHVNKIRKSDTNEYFDDAGIELTVADNMGLFSDDPSVNTQIFKSRENNNHGFDLAISSYAYNSSTGAYDANGLFSFGVNHEGYVPFLREDVEVGLDYTFSSTDMLHTHRINLEDQDGNPVEVEGDIVAGDSSVQCEYNGSDYDTAYCAVAPDDDDSASVNLEVPGFVYETKAIPNRYGLGILVQAETDITLDFAYVVDVRNAETNASITNATVQMGDSAFDIDCTHLGSGEYGCAVPVDEDHDQLKVAASGYGTETVTLTASQIRDNNEDSQVDIDVKLSESSEPTPEPETTGVDLDVDNIYLDSDDDLKFRVSNDGSEDVSEDDDVRIKVYVDGDRIYQTDVRNETSSSWLDAGGSATYNMGSVLRDEADVRVCVDTEDAVSETDESNNCLEKELDPDGSSKPDLTAVDIELEEDGDLRVTLMNEGRGDVDDDIEVLVYAYIDGDVEWEKEYENDYSDSWLNAGEEERIRISNFVPDHDDDEIYGIKVCVDKSDRVNESNEGDNCNTVSLRLGEHEDDDRNDNRNSYNETDCGFVDMNRHWASEEVCELVDRDIVQGRSSRYYEPNSFVTRAEFLKMMLLTSGRDPEYVAGYYYNDVPEYHWAHDYITYASSMDVAKGYGNGEFRPNANVTRGEAVVMIMRLYGEELWGFDENDIIFPDVDRWDWHAYAVILAESYDIVNGYADGTFRPGNELTRAEAAVIMMNMDDALN